MELQRCLKEQSELGNDGVPSMEVQPCLKEESELGEDRVPSKHKLGWIKHIVIFAILLTILGLSCDAHMASQMKFLNTDHIQNEAEGIEVKDVMDKAVETTGQMAKAMEEDLEQVKQDALKARKGIQDWIEQVENLRNGELQKITKRFVSAVVSLSHLEIDFKSWLSVQLTHYESQHRILTRLLKDNKGKINVNVPKKLMQHAVKDQRLNRMTKMVGDIQKQMSTLAAVANTQMIKVEQQKAAAEQKLKEKAAKAHNIKAITMTAICATGAVPGGILGGFTGGLGLIFTAMSAAACALRSVTFDNSDPLKSFQLLRARALKSFEAAKKWFGELKDKVTKMAVRAKSDYNKMEIIDSHLGEVGATDIDRSLVQHFVNNGLKNLIRSMNRISTSIRIDDW